MPKRQSGNKKNKQSNFAKRDEIERTEKKEKITN